MVELDNPKVILNEYLGYIKLCHVLGGIYIWEFVITLDFEWKVIQGRRPYRHTIWIYSFTRWSSFLAIIVIFLGLDTERQINCQLWIMFVFILGCLSSSTALSLIVLRTIAIWDRNKIIIVITTGVWLAYLGTAARGMYFSLFVPNVDFLRMWFDHGGTATTQLRSSWTGTVCNPPNMKHEKAPFIILFAGDLTLVSIMFLGLLRLRSRSGGLFGIGKLLWKQGVIWLMFATGAGLLHVVIICLNLSPIFNTMFVMLMMVSISITATRLYISLTDFGSSTDIVVDFDRDRGRRAIANANAKGMPVVHVHMAHEEFPTVMTPGVSPHLDIRGQPCDKTATVEP